MLYRSIYIGNPAHLKLKDKQLKITNPTTQTISYKLLSITKLQNLKAIHNNNLTRKSPYIVVINHKITRFESNSQLRQLAECPTKCCYQSQNYKI